MQFRVKAKSSPAAGNTELLNSRIYPRSCTTGSKGESVGRVHGVCQQETRVSCFPPVFEFIRQDYPWGHPARA